MLPNDDTDGLRQKLMHAEAVIVELRGVVAELRKQIDSQQAHIHLLVKITFGRGGERIEGPRLFDAMDAPEANVPTPIALSLLPSQICLQIAKEKVRMRRTENQISHFQPYSALGWTNR